MSSLKKKLIIGSRGSLLALTQTENIKKALEEKTSLDFEVRVIKTQGDLQTQKPLWELKGENFFTRELDEALIKKEVDLVVHSFKDLGGTRPEEITLAAIPKRSFPHDILLIKNATLERLSTMEEFNIGTSSPRRMYLAKKLLPELIPFGKNINFTTSPLRGNVNTRLKKLQDGEYDAIILALAGLERLSENPKAREEILPSLEDLNFMLLPLSEFTCAPAQGALALECLKENTELLKEIQKLSDEKTQTEVLREKEIFAKYGGGCHQAIGAYVQLTPTGKIEIEKGIKGEEEISKLRLEGGMAKPLTGKKIFIGLSSKPENESYLSDELGIKKYLNTAPPSLLAHSLVTSKHCVAMLKKIYEGGNIWAAGVRTMMTLAREKFWVNGCADFYGVKEIEGFQNSAFLKLLQDETLPWQVLTAKDGHSTLGPIVPCYERAWKKASLEYQRKLENCEIYYWMSYPQYEAFLRAFPWLKEKNHACGLGKTYEEFKKKNIEVTPYASLELFKENYL